MDISQTDLVPACILGVVEGLTEYLPISSTGHMIIAGHLLNFEGEKADTFEIVIQLGAILSVVVLYFRRFLGLLKFSDSGGLSGIQGLLKIGIACVPAALVGLVAHKKIKALLFAPGPVAAALILGGLVMLFVDERDSETEQTLDDITFRDAVLVGLFQCLSLWPGMSRSGSMIVGGMLIGMRRIVAAEFSFLVAVPIMILASGYDLLKSRDLLSATDIPLFAVGFATAFVVAMVSVKFFISVLRRVTLRPFGVYRIALGVAVLYLLHGVALQ
ncbi:MAG: undecaprenyl-diphosphate phosphatase [Bdellovibrionota bacterium]